MDAMDEGARRWLYKTARANYWRVAAWYDVDDLIQEGFAAFYKTQRYYPDVAHPGHRMALFKRVFMSRLHDLANQRTRQPPEVCFSALFADDGEHSPDQRAGAFIEGIAADPDIADARRALLMAPAYVRQALALIESGDPRLRSAYRKVRAGRVTRRETLNERLCRLMGRDPTRVDVVAAIRAVLGGASSGARVLVEYCGAASVTVERVAGGRWYVEVRERGDAPRPAICREV